MSLNIGSNNSNVVKPPFKTLKSVDIEIGTVSFKEGFESVDEIVAFQGFLMDYGVQDATIKDAYGIAVGSLEQLLTETTITLSHDAIALCELALEKQFPKAKRLVSKTKDNISLILPAKKSPITSGTSI